MRSFTLWLAVALLSVAAHARAGAIVAPSYVRTSLDDDAAPLRILEARRIRSSLDSVSHAEFPLETGRIIRVSLDGGIEAYGRLGPAPAPRRVRVTLD